VYFNSIWMLFIHADEVSLLFLFRFCFWKKKNASEPNTKPCGIKQQQADGPVQSFLCSFSSLILFRYFIFFRASRGRKLWLVSFDGRLPLVKKQSRKKKKNLHKKTFFTARGFTLYDPTFFSCQREHTERTYTRVSKK
jgi:hypothetical protein